MKSLFVLIAFVAQLSTIVLAVEISGEIVSCSGWNLNSFPELKEFIKYGGAEAFHNVEINFNRGRKATLTIYHDGIEQEKVDLKSLGTQEKMHQMMLDKGFVLKSEEEIAMIKEQGLKHKAAEERIQAFAKDETEKRRATILEEQRYRAETFHGSTKGDELTKLTQRIKELKKDGGNEELLKELEQRRVEIMRQEMLSRQYQLQMAQEKKESHDEL